MNVALDYDETYTLDPLVWDKIIKLLINEGHHVYCVTKRYESIADDIKLALDIPIIFVAKGVAKLQAVRLKGIKIDIWIDDKPQSITPYKRGSGTLINKGFARW